MHASSKQHFSLLLKRKKRREIFLLLEQAVEKTITAPRMQIYRHIKCKARLGLYGLGIIETDLYKQRLIFISITCDRDTGNKMLYCTAL